MRERQTDRERERKRETEMERELEIERKVKITEETVRKKGNIVQKDQHKVHIS